jgi:hypothetical protein
MLNSTAAVATPVSNAPFYRAVRDEVEVFRAAARRGLPVLLKGPTGCGKTRFVEAMAHQLDRDLITVAGHEDMTSADLVGRFLLKGGETVWVDGPLTRAVREGAIFYLDEVVEARQARIDIETARSLVKLAYAIRNLDGSPLREVSSTRMLILAGGLAAEGLNLRSAVHAAVVQVLSDDYDVIRALDELVNTVLPQT